MPPGEYLSIFLIYLEMVFIIILLADQQVNKSTVP